MRSHARVARERRRSFAFSLGLLRTPLVMQNFLAFSSLIIVSDFRYKALGLTEAGHTWKLFFKIFCFLEPESVEPDSVEYGFLYEQVRLSVLSLCVLTFVICWVYTSLLLQVKFVFRLYS